MKQASRRMPSSNVLSKIITPSAIRKKIMPAKFSAKQSSKDGHAVVHETSAGGVVFHRTTRDIQFAVILDSYNHWAFPKGRVEGSEYLEEAAARETMEELGL